MATVTLFKTEIFVRMDGLFGECASTEHVASILPNPTDYILKEVLSNQLEKLDREGYSLEDARTQCLITYFKVVLMLQLKYDLNFCDVINPKNIWQMLQSIKLAIINDVSQLQNINSAEGILYHFVKQQRNIESANDVKSSGSDSEEYSISGRNMLEDNNNLGLTTWNTEKKPINNDNNMIAVENSMSSSEVPNSGEEEEEESLNFADHQAPVFKKDIEHLGLEKTEHKIVKGMPSYQKVDGNRVYLKVAKNVNDNKLRHLISYLDISIAKPNQLIFDDFLLDGNQLSFRAGRSTLTLPENEKRLDSVGGIAEDVYKRRKDIQTVSGIHVDETGIGSGEDAVPVESETRDRFFIPILAVCAFTIVILLSVLTIHQIKEYRKKKRKCGIPEVDSQKALLAYQDLCRYRMNYCEGTGIIEPHSNHSNKASSWVEEPIGQSNIDISTGHVILSFLRDYLNDASKIEEQWKTLDGYVNPNGIASIAGKEENIEKNRNGNCLPYDDTLVSIRDTLSDSVFINASAIHDCDPKQASYIATQSPLPKTIADFWEMIWEQVTALIVNLTNNDDLQEGRCLKYWPESGSQIYGCFEIHLVSEHIWSEDYMVRSFYLKSLKTNETRTVTQFHFLTWPKKGVPPSTKALLDFRRKINKSYRGRAVPIVVHSTDGTGRTGTFCLLDMILSRVARGVKELNVAGSLEHLRDQRPGMVETCEQYKMVFVCLAEEITAIVAALS
uniref:Tyrosine-protein phosphatase domain-containing protein n=1 Tax=Setaria digitata TaxID=48799 RepID=A0A915Q479_9BILA